MHAIEFNELLNRAISRAIKEGINQNEITWQELIGILEMQKAGVTDLYLTASRQAAMAAARSAPPAIVPSTTLPANPKPGPS